MRTSALVWAWNCDINSPGGRHSHDKGAKSFCNSFPHKLVIASLAIKADGVSYVTDGLRDIFSSFDKETSNEFCLPWLQFPSMLVGGSVGSVVEEPDLVVVWSSLFTKKVVRSK